MDGNLTLGLLNLHDAFLNASLMLKHVQLAPLDVNKPQEFHISDRGRFERTWVAYLYVLIEAWESAQMSPVREYIATVTSTRGVEDLIAQGRANGDIAKMFNVRSYMCHRDRREYWDQGRIGVLGQLECHLNIHNAFSKLLLTAMRGVNEKAKT